MKILLIIFLYVSTTVYCQEKVQDIFDKSWKTKDTIEKRILREKIVKDYNNSKYGLFSKAWFFSIRDSNFSAIEYYTKALNDDNNFWQAHYNLGVTYYKLKEYHKAIYHYTKVISINPDFLEVYYNRGSSYLKLKEFRNAITNYSKLIQISPNSAEAYNALGLAHLELKEFNPAVDNFSKAIELNPQYEDAYYNRGDTYFKAMFYNYAILDFTKVIEINPNSGNVYNYRGTAYFYDGDRNAACDDWYKAKMLGFDAANGNYDNNCIRIYSSVKDIDGNIYNTMIIGYQEWMTENLNVSHYRNGDIIPQVQNQIEWDRLKTGAWCYYDNNPENGKRYGKLYNWYAVNDPRGLSPEGWHVPSRFVNPQSIQLNKTLLLGGMRGGPLFEGGDNFMFMGSSDYYWTSNEYNISLAWYQNSNFNNYKKCYENYDTKNYGLSVRCLKN